ncbi:MAG: hypothetical protein FJ146_07040 [Deltaproteobacteria bacterium]|nr:hypothetical protein [Deltaproteobacteria bacterium]
MIKRTQSIVKLLLVSILSMASACSYSIHQQYIGSMDPNASYGKGKWVEATSSDFVILSFAMQSNYVEDAYRQLENQCKGRIAQVTTEHLTAYKFLSYEQKLVLKGLCQS